MIGNDCRCPGCGTCGAASEVARLRKQLADEKLESASWRATARDKGYSAKEVAKERDALQAKLDAELPAMWREDVASLNECLERVGRERDEARAEVARLCEAMTASMNLCSWECSGETYCGRCAPLARALNRAHPEPEEDER